MQDSILSISKDIRTKLKNLYPTHEIDAFIFLIFEHICNFSRTQILAYPEKEVSEPSLNRIKALLIGLRKKEPIQYLLESTEFYELQFAVNENVLIPRPETEELVHWILTDIDNSHQKVLDIGTGSGSIAISLAKNRTNWDVQAIDISLGALSVAKQNALANQVEISFIEANALNLDALCKTVKYFDIIVSNPPYVCQNEKKLMESNVLENEPHLALFVENNDPLLFYRKIGEFAKENLSKKGLLYFEINEKFGVETCELLERIGFNKTELRKDINGKHRMVKAWI